MRVRRPLVVSLALVVGLALAGCTAAEPAPTSPDVTAAPPAETAEPAPTATAELSELGQTCATVATMLARIAAAQSAAATAGPEQWLAAVVDAQSLASTLPDRPDLAVFQAEVQSLPSTAPTVNTFGAGVLDSSSGPTFIDACAAEGAEVPAG